jgi:phosphoglycolate phosphatase-like HAD superfamily hydrolase
LHHLFGPPIAQENGAPIFIADEIAVFLCLAPTDCREPRDPTLSASSKYARQARRHRKERVAMAIAIVFFDLGETLVTRPRCWLPGAQAVLSSLRQAGVRLGIISNTPDLAKRAAILELLPTDFDLGAFDANLILFSSEIKMEKPHRAIFEEAVMRAGKPANQCLYCSEDIVETLMAQQVGMRSIRVQTRPNSDLGELQKRIEEFDVLVGKDS